MENHQFHQFIESLMQQIEDMIDRHSEDTGEDIDCERHGNVMIITLPNQHKIIINSQEPLSQIWMATHRQGYHFNYHEGHWYCTRSKQELMGLLTQAIQSNA